MAPPASAVRKIDVGSGTVFSPNEIAREGKLLWFGARPKPQNGGSLTLKARSGSVRAWKEPLPASNSGPTPRRAKSDFLSAKLSFRLVPGQTTSEVRPLIESWFQEQFSKCQVRGEIDYDHGGEPFFVAPDEPMLRKASRALEDVFGYSPTLTREGLSIPASVMLQQALGAPVLLVGLGLPDCRAHGPDECYPVEHLDLGRRVFWAMVREFAKLDSL